MADFDSGIRRFPGWLLLAANRHCLATTQLSAQMQNTLARRSSLLSDLPCKTSRFLAVLALSVQSDTMKRSI
jgi:hypothetical protein